MTEAEWLDETDPTKMLEFLSSSGSPRKFRLYACACCRIVWKRLEFAICQHIVEVSERYADGVATEDERLAVCIMNNSMLKGVSRTNRDPRVNAFLASRATAYHNDATYVSAIEAQNNSHRLIADENWQTRAGLPFSEILRDIFGNLFRPVAFDPAWRTSTAISIAEGIYNDRAFDRLPILADALQDAGCENADLLNHLRGEGPHVKGCWALDLVLGKE